MKWSKLKKILENGICEDLKQRLRLNLTHYRAAHEPESRFWITFDGKEIYSSSKLHWLNEWVRIKNECRENIRSNKGQSDYAKRLLESDGQYYIDDVLDSLELYSNLSIEEALTSSNFMIRSLSMIDKRLGKRRLARMRLGENEHLLVKQLYDIRCNAETIDSDPDVKCFP